VVTGNTVSSDSTESPYVSDGISVTQNGYLSATTVSGNSVTGASQYGVQVTVQPGSTVSPVVQNNSVSATGFEAVAVASNQLLPANLTGNTGTSSTRQAMILTGTLVGNLTLPFGSLGLTLAQAYCCSGGYYGMLTVGAGVTLTVNAGVVIKSYGAGLESNGGTINATGTAQQPVIFTSVKDDTAGGDYNKDGNVTTPAPGDWQGISVNTGGTFDLEATNIRYASTALSADNSTSGVFHGSVVTSAFGVAGGDSYIDATNVDWGSPSGPAPIGSGVPISGTGVLVTPWVGFVPPPAPTSTPPYVPPTTYTCTKVAFIGARGSGEPPTGDNQTYLNPADGLGAKLPGLLDGINSTLSNYGYSSSDVKVLAVQYRALEANNPLNYITQAYFDSVYDGVNKTVSMILDEESHCPSEKLILAGYSQGALAIHLALMDLASADPGTLSSIAAVLMIADPAKVGYAAEETWELDELLAGPGVSAADGIWTKSAPHSMSGPLPSLVTGRTLAICHNQDIVCSPGLWSTIDNHTSYDTSEENDMGVWAADTLLGIQPPPVA
jgi:hypothetical protein